jgi:long-chain acyl-CoA synthetase
VTLTQRNVMAATLNYLADVDSIEPGDAIIHAAPMSHGSGFYMLPHVARGGLNVVTGIGRLRPGRDLRCCRHIAA